MRVLMLFFGRCFVFISCCTLSRVRDVCVCVCFPAEIPYLSYMAMTMSSRVPRRSQFSRL
ncbi:hypothetical protein BDV98DRAFT_567756 [Pterulicium gracile]|uniref:Secreted protein n=1 Tax=Pterulicium gracile TaxID=1884261 RepID=A0A5C3QGM9_9AGAR|nr:hypothetical protein BDV98DRAFT_567756 [Pterula gracilis]